MIRDYLIERPKSILHRTFVLIDARRGVTKPDFELLSILDEQAVKYVIVLTKVDLIKPALIPSLMQKV